MKKTAEAVSLGHPDKMADYISSYILDRMIEQDAAVKYAVEVMVKDNTVVLGGEITGDVNLARINFYVAEALAEIGYDKFYSHRWGNYAINPEKLQIINLIGKQSADISQGVEQDGWGDQGVFVGYACQGTDNISREQYLAKKLCNALYEYALQNIHLGIDIKTQITLNELGGVETVVVAVPMLKDVDLTTFIVLALGEEPENIIVNGTGTYNSARRSLIFCSAVLSFKPHSAKAMSLLCSDENFATSSVVALSSSCNFCRVSAWSSAARLATSWLSTNL